MKGVDLILHAGDIYISSALDWLEAIAPVMAARGNGDAQVRDDPRVQDSLVLDLDGLRVGVTHAVIYPETTWGTLEQTMERKFRGPVDVIVFGDTHTVLVERYKGVLLVNPGSPTYPKNFLELGTVGILEIKGGQAQASILSLK